MSTEAMRAVTINVETMLGMCVPGGTSCDPQHIADAIRIYCAALAQRADKPVACNELGDRFMEILRAIHGDMPDAFADSARLAFVHALKEMRAAQAAPAYVPLIEDDIDNVITRVVGSDDVRIGGGYTYEELHELATAIEALVVARMRGEK